MSPLGNRLATAVGERGSVVILTGAGVSAESGVPTFRGEDGYWTLGSHHHHPQEMATHAMFQRDPVGVWSWYLHRLGICRNAQPNPAHVAIAKTQSLLGTRCTLITQNVDGLHARAGSPHATSLAIHGDIQHKRCIQGCRPPLQDIPLDGLGVVRDSRATDAQMNALRCAQCDGLTRPHVLWFDECYDEALYRMESALRATLEASAVISVGTTGTTSLPARILQIARERKILVLDVNPEVNPFAETADETGGWVRASAGNALPPLLSELR